MSLQIDRDLDVSIRSSGFATIRGAEIVLTPDMASELEALRRCWNNLDPDPYYGGNGKSHRVRRYSDFQYDPVTDTLTRCDHVPYFQSIRQNAYVGGKERHFGDVLPETYENRFFKALVRYDFDRFPMPEEYRSRTWICQVHMIRIIVEAGETTQVTPEGIHSDGYPFAGVHLMNRVGVEGGESTVYTAEAEPLASLTFEQPMDSLFFEDRRMKHYVTPISAGAERAGHRDILAISFSLPESEYETDA